MVHRSKRLKRGAIVQQQRLRLLIVAIIFAIIGVVAYTLVRAAGPSANLEPENGAVSGPATTQSATDASGGKYVRFQATPTQPTGFAIPKSGALFGMFSATNGQGSGPGRLESRMGRKLDLRMQFMDWTTTGNGGLLAALNNGFIQDDFNNNRTPVISWEASRWSQGLGDNNIPAIANGQYDGYVRQVARKLKSYNKPVLMRWAHEMNGFWYGWSKASTGEYKNAWRKMVTLFREEGANNVVWVWCPFGVNFPNQGGKPFADYYPGDSYVDIVGIDIYAEQRGQTMGDVLPNGQGSVYATYKDRKPIFIMESMNGPRGGNHFQDKTNYFNQMVNVLKSKFPQMRGVVLFDENKLSTEGADFSIEKTSSGAANTNNMNAFVNMTSNCYFGTDARQAACKGQ